MSTGKLLGNESGSPAQGDSLDIFRLYRYQATATGKVSQIRLYATGSGYAKIALYADSGGEPGSRLAKQDTSMVIYAGWNLIDLESACSVIKDTWYWLALNEGTANIFVYEYGAGVRQMRYKTGQTYSSFTFPNPAGSGFSTLTDYEAFIAGYGVLVVAPSSISQPVSYGSPKLKLFIKPSSILQALAYGTPVVLTSAKTIQPSSIVQPIVFGMPSLRYPQTISLLSIVQQVAIGTPSVGTYGILRPQSTIQQISIGSPTLLKYVWHVILDGQYATETPGVNRSYIIGRDQYGNPVYGTAVNTDEVALVGERLDFQQELAIPIDSQAASMASAILSKWRLSKARGIILVPPNCGQELFDAVQISDSGANQSAVKFRVVGIRFEYNPKQAKYEHKLILGAP